MAKIVRNGIQYSGSGEPLVYDDMSGATSTTGGVHGLVPAPSAGDNEKFLSGDGSWKSAGEYVTKEATGNPIELTDAASAPMVRCVTEIQGSQDLHGYDKPWVGGAGKNKLNLDITNMKAANTSGTWNGNTYTFNGRTFKINTLDGVNAYSIDVSGASSGYPALYSGGFKLPVGTYTLTFTTRIRVYKNNAQIIDATSTTTITSDNASDDYYIAVFPGGSEITYTEQPMIRLSTETDPTFAPYSNICPITSYDEGEIEVREENIFDYSTCTNVAIDNSGNEEEFIIRLTGDYDEVTPNTTYNIIDIPTGITVIGYADYSSNKTFIRRIVIDATTNTTITPQGSFVRLLFRKTDQSGLSSENVKTVKLLKNLPTTHTTTYPSAIYRGSEDVVNGEVTAQKTVLEINSSSSLGFDYATNICTLSNSGFATVTSENISQYICNRLTVHANSQIGTMSYEFTVDGNGALKFKIPNLTSLQDYQSWLADNPLEIVGVLATPTTSSVTPTNLPIKSLSGYSHIESSTGDMEIEYITQDYQPLVDLIEANSGKHVYSTQEQVVGTWIDGSTVYEKTVVVNSGFSESMTVNHGIANVDKIIGVEGMVETSYPAWFPLTDNVPATGYNITVDGFNRTTFDVYIGSVRVSEIVAIYVTIRYTKTT